MSFLTDKLVGVIIGHPEYGLIEGPILCLFQEFLQLIFDARTLVFVSVGKLRILVNVDWHKVATVYIYFDSLGRVLQVVHKLVQKSALHWRIDIPFWRLARQINVGANLGQELVQLG